MKSEDLPAAVARDQGNRNSIQSANFESGLLICKAIPPCLLKALLGYRRLASAVHPKPVNQTPLDISNCPVNPHYPMAHNPPGPLHLAPHLSLSAHFPCNPLPPNHLPKQAVQHRGVVYRGPLRKQEDCDTFLPVIAPRSTPLRTTPRAAWLRLRLKVVLPGRGSICYTRVCRF